MDLSKQAILESLALLPIGYPSYGQAHPILVNERLTRLAKNGASVRQIGVSRSGQWPISGVMLGDENLPVIAMVANNHPEEVAGTLTILLFFELLLSNPRVETLLKQFRFVGIPQTNPDGVMWNMRWLNDPAVATYFMFKFRDFRGEDVEHGIPTLGESYVRPEPKAIVDFLTQEAAGRTSFYATLHSCQWQSGPYVLSGSSDLSHMGEAFELLEDAAVLLGFRVKTEDWNGFKGMRLIRPGVYTVARRKEMNQRNPQAGIKTNTLEWMEQQGCPISLVSEFPTFIPRQFIDEPAPDSTEVDAYEVMSGCVPVIENYLREKSILIDLLHSSRHSNDVLDSAYAAWLKEAYLRFEMRKAVDFQQSVLAFKGQPVLKSQIARRNSAVAYYDAKLGGHALRALRPGAARDLGYEDRFYRALIHLEASVELTKKSMVSVDAQVRYQMAVLLGGIAAASKLQ